MKTFTARDLRSAVLLAVIVTAVTVLALTDRGCQLAERRTPSRAIAP